MTSALLIDLPPVVELRQYTLRPGRRDELVELFEAELLEPQEQAGMQVLGTFRDLDRPDRFVWLRGFPDMAARARSLAAFYGGPVWARHRDAANATMLDSDDVLLLRPVGGTVRLPAAGDDPVLTAEVLLLRRPVDEAFLGFHAAEVEPVLERAGSRRLALLETEPAPTPSRACRSARGSTPSSGWRAPPPAPGRPSAAGSRSTWRRRRSCCASGRRPGPASADRGAGTATPTPRYGRMARCRARDDATAPSSTRSTTPSAGGCWSGRRSAGSA
jgi:hypothetical protein